MQLKDTNRKLAELRTQQQELEVHNQMLENTAQTHTSSTSESEDFFLWKVLTLLCSLLLDGCSVRVNMGNHHVICCRVMQLG